MFPALLQLTITAMTVRRQLAQVYLLINFFAVNCQQTGSRPSQQDGQCSRMYKWRPEEEHPCNIPKLNVAQLKSQFGSRGLTSLYHTPIIIQRGTKGRNEKFFNMTSQSGIVSVFPSSFEVTLSSSNSFSAHRRRIPISQYLEEILETGETSPDQLSNETWYLFGETYSSEWKELLSHYELPPCQTCVRSLVALSFGIGNRGSGVQWHVHGPGFAETLWGQKHWVLYPPDEKPDFHPDQTSRNWMEYTYPAVRKRPHECTLYPGDMIYFPNMWWHATINLIPYTSFVSSFTTEHDAHQMEEEMM
jgi:Cupin-like domain